jgi:S1-C subfamily serine protease/cytochrome c-type biogenesis protein CcmH/NrfG
MHYRNVAALLSLVLLTAASGKLSLPQPTRQLTVADVVKRNSGAVVQIIVSDRTGNQISLGSGFIVSTDGRIATNYHVIEGGHSALVKLANGSLFPVEGLLAADADMDLVILKVAGKGLPYLNLESIHRLQVGDHVIAIGSPLGLEGTVSDGIVSALRDEAPGKTWIQTSAPVSHGNSGGPLLSMDGNVVGVITWGVNLQQGENLNFAIPSDEVKSLLSSPQELVSFDAVISAHGASTRSAPPSNASPDHKEAKSLIDSGLKAINSKEYEQAVHDFKAALAIDQENADSWHGLGIAHAFLGQIEESSIDFAQAVKYAPNDEGYWVSLGVAYRDLSKYAEAQSALQEAVGISPTDATAWLYLGKTYDALHNRAQAVRCYERVTSITPSDAEAWYQLGETSESIAALRKAVELKPDYAKAWAALALDLDSAKQYDQAVGAWKKLLAVKYDDAFLSDARIWWFIGGAYSNLSDLKSAEQAYLEALQIEQALPAHTSADNDLIGNIFEALYLTDSKMGKHRDSEKYRQNFVYWEQNKSK